MTHDALSHDGPELSHDGPELSHDGPELSHDGPELVGVGVGPGDPELVTVRAVRILRGADLILVPAQNGAAGRERTGREETGRAQATVLAHLDTEEQRARVVPVAFAMGERTGLTGRRTEAWRAAADRVLQAFDRGARTVAFATIGDPNVYSTFSYVAQTVRADRPDVVVSTVPGITAMQDLASRAGISLCEGTESLALVPATAGPETYRELLRTADTVVAYKGGRQLATLLQVLAEEGRLEQTVVGSGLGLPEESLRSAEELAPTGSHDPRGARRNAPGDAEPAPYLTTVITPARRAVRGGRL
ncbi:MAG: precorrin-2/cobalt-factor-2 C20-methyltransferase [Actinomycetota bacterium]|nr:precorrin-2/cobalt-factor-2 C20-methyltransferase [Actinomycetota bacterium]